MTRPQSGWTVPKRVKARVKTSYLGRIPAQRCWILDCLFHSVASYSEFAEGSGQGGLLSAGSAWLAGWPGLFRERTRAKDDQAPGAIQGHLAWV